jgi:hypothetical protein
LTLPARERSKGIQTILVLAFIKFLCLGAYGCSGILASALEEENLRQNKSCVVREINQTFWKNTYLAGIALKEANFLVKGHVIGPETFHFAVE